MQQARLWAQLTLKLAVPGSNQRASMQAQRAWPDSVSLSTTLDVPGRLVRRITVHSLVKASS